MDTQEDRSRKSSEKEFHDRLRGTYELDALQYSEFTANKKYYSVTDSSTRYINHLLTQYARQRRVLDFGSGGGGFTRRVAQHARFTVGVDISDQSVEQSAGRLSNSQPTGTIVFAVGDCEALPFGDAMFDLVVETGVLHHLELLRAYREIARVLKPDGVAICVEALRHNPFIHLYRRLTPKLRTQWETKHIVGRAELRKAQEFFQEVDLRFFHLCVLAAVPLRNTSVFSRALWFLDIADDYLLRLPALRWWAWEAVIVLKRPRR